MTYLTNNKAHHEYCARLTQDNWRDLMAVKKLTNKSINALLNEGVADVIKRTKEQMAQQRLDRESIRTAAAFK